MDFNLKKFATDASGLFNRAKQLTEEKFLHAEKTELDPTIENLLHKADRAEEQTRKLLSALEAYLQPNPGLKFIKNFFFKTLCIFSTARGRSAVGKIGFRTAFATIPKGPTPKQFGTFGSSNARSGTNIRPGYWLWRCSDESGSDTNETGCFWTRNGPNYGQSDFGPNSAFPRGRHEEHPGILFASGIILKSNYNLRKNAKFCKTNVLIWTLQRVGWNGQEHWNHRPM